MSSPREARQEASHFPEVWKEKIPGYCEAGRGLQHGVGRSLREEGLATGLRGLRDEASGVFTAACCRGGPAS